MVSDLARPDICGGGAAAIVSAASCWNIAAGLYHHLTEGSCLLLSGLVANHMNNDSSLGLNIADNLIHFWHISRLYVH